MKPKYHKMFMEVVESTAKLSTCVLYQVGVVVVRDSRIILQGYNGTVNGFINCSDKFPNGVSLGENRANHSWWSKAFEVHAEMNAICYAARKGISLDYTTFYCSYSPCNNCLKHMIQAGIKEVVYKKIYIQNNLPKEETEDRKELEKFIKLTQYKDHD